MGKLFIVIGTVLIIVGILLETGVSLPLGRLPGDLRFESGNSKVYIPITSSLLISVVLSLIIYLVRRF